MRLGNRKNQQCVRLAACPTCGAGAGELCINRTGAVAGHVHEARYDAWSTEWLPVYLAAWQGI